MAEHTEYGNKRYKAAVLELLESQREELWKLRYLGNDICSLLGEIAQLLRAERAEPAPEWQYRLQLPAEPKGEPECPTQKLGV